MATPKTCPGRIDRFLHFAGLDFHIIVTLLLRGWSTLAGAATALLIPIFLTPSEQGYYYTFASVLALQIFFELGLNQVLLQLVSHEVAHLTPSKDGRLEGPSRHLERLGSLARLVRHWYAVAAILFAIIGGGVGVWFFLRVGTLSSAQWLGAWVVIVGATSFSLWYSPGLTVIEGCGHIGQVARLRLVQSIVGYCVFWLLLISRAGLWVAAAVPVTGVLCTSYWLRHHGDMLSWLASRPAGEIKRLHWRTDVFPFQWRVAISWMSGYFILNLFTPLVFARQGAAEAGRLGLALTLFSAISIIGMSWVNAKIPAFAMHIARGEREYLNAKFRTVASRSMVFTAIASLLTVAICWALSAQGLSFMQRIASPNVLACLALVTIANGAIFSAAIYMRAHREEPMLPISVVMAILVGLAGYFGSRWGQLQMVALYAIATSCISLPWTGRLFLRYYRKTV